MFFRKLSGLHGSHNRPSESRNGRIIENFFSVEDLKSGKYKCSCIPQGHIDFFCENVAGYPEMFIRRRGFLRGYFTEL